MHESVSKDHDYCPVEMPEAYNKILKFNHEQKSVCTRTQIAYSKKQINIHRAVVHFSYTIHWQQQKQTWFLKRWRPYEKVLYRPKK